MSGFQIQTYTIKTKKLKKGTRLTLSLLADLHNREYGPGNAELFSAIRAQRPDVILVAGDMLISELTASFEPAQNLIGKLQREVAPVYYNGDMAFVTDDEFIAILGHEIPESERDMSLPIDKNCTLEYAAGTNRGEKITKLITAVVEKIGGGGINSEMMKSTAFQIPLRCFVTMSSGVFNDEMCDALCDVLNDKPLTPSALKLVKNIPSALMKLPDLFKSM